VTTEARSRLTFGSLLWLNAAWVGLSFMWNGLHVILLPAVMLQFVPETHKNTYLGSLTFAGLVIAMMVQPLAGAVSDGWVSPWGRRRPLIALGTGIDLLFLALLAWAGGLAWLVAGYLGLQLSSNVAHGALQGLLPDRVPREQLGQASALKNLFDMSGLVVASLLTGRLLRLGSGPPLAAVGAIALVLVASTAATLRLTPEAPHVTSTGRRPAGWRELMTVDWRAHTGYWWLIGSRFVYLFGVYGVQAFAQYYVRDVLAVPNPVQVTGDLSASIAGALLVFVVIGGWLCDRVGRRRVQVAAGLITALGCLLLLGASTPARLLAFGSVVGVGIGLFITANWALANQLAPRAEEGKFIGLTNLATAGAGAVSRLQGPMIDALNLLQPGAYWGYSALFVVAAVCVLGSLAFLRKVGVQT
jgi:MFS family permease